MTHQSGEVSTPEGTPEKAPEVAEMSARRFCGNPTCGQQVREGAYADGARAKGSM